MEALFFTFTAHDAGGLCSRVFATREELRLAIIEEVEATISEDEHSEILEPLERCQMNGPEWNAIIDTWCKKQALKNCEYTWDSHELDVQTNNHAPHYTKNQRVTVSCDVDWTEGDEEVQHIKKGPSIGTIVSVDVREDVTIYQITLDQGGMFLFNFNADGPVVQPLA